MSPTSFNPVPDSATRFARLWRFCSERKIGTNPSRARLAYISQNTGNFLLVDVLAHVAQTLFIQG